MICDCYYCAIERKPHPASHGVFYETTSVLVKADSLDPDDSVRMEACLTCGHVQPMTEAQRQVDQARQRNDWMARAIPTEGDQP